jgi:hypothetical protein
MSSIRGKPDEGAVMSTAEPMEGCSKFYRCSTNVCPLDTDWRKRKHIEGESVCSYLLESVKASGADVFEADSLAFLLAKAREIGAAFPAIGRALAKASGYGSRVIKAARMRACKDHQPAPMPRVHLERIPASGRPQNGLPGAVEGASRGHA